MPEEITAERLPELLRPGMTVFIEGASGEPTPLLEALAAAPEASAGVHYVGCRIPGLNTIDPAAFHPAARLTSFFVFGDIASSHAAGRVRFLPLHYSGIWQYLAALPVDLALLQVSPPDAEGCAASASRSISCRRCCARRSSSWPRSTRPCRARPRATPSPGGGSTT